LSFNEDSFELASGLPLDGATVTITKSEFGYRQNIAPNTTFACFTFQPEVGDEQEQAYSTGKGWEPGAKGATLVRSDGRKGKLNDQTGYGKWIAAAIALPGVLDYLRANGGDALVASTWDGMRFELGSVREETTNPTTNQKKEVSRIIPVEFLGAGEGAGVAKAAGGKVGGKGEAKVAIDAELEANLVKLAEACDNHDDFMAAAYELEGVAGNAAVEEAVLAHGKGSIWARGQA
jgi:hypothetical protein